MAAHVATITADLNRYAGEEKRRAQRRAERVIGVVEEVEAARQRSDLRLLGNQQKMLDSVFKKYDEIEKARKEHEQKVAELTKTVRESGKTFEVPANTLVAMEEALAKIALRTERKEQLKFFIAFAKNAAQKYRDLRKEADAASESAEATSRDKSDNAETAIDATKQATTK